MQYCYCQFLPVYLIKERLYLYCLLEVLCIARNLGLVIVIKFVQLIVKYIKDVLCNLIIFKVKFILHSC